MDPQQVAEEEDRLHRERMRRRDADRPQSRTATQMRDQGEAQMPMNTASCRASAASMLHSEAASLRHQADQLDALAKIAAFAEGTPAEEALWSLVVRNRR